MGELVGVVLDDLVWLCIVVFCDWLYFYDGDLGYECDYLIVYQLFGVVVVVVFDGNCMIGVVIGVLMEYYVVDFVVVFVNCLERLDEIFYCVELVLLFEYCRWGLGYVFFDGCEVQVCVFGCWFSVFCSVQCFKDYLMCLVDYCLLDDFWCKRGYELFFGVIVVFDWKDVGVLELMKKLL